jgi:hypothetical protein
MSTDIVPITKPTIGINALNHQTRATTHGSVVVRGAVEYGDAEKRVGAGRCWVLVLLALIFRKIETLDNLGLGEWYLGQFVPALLESEALQLSHTYASLGGWLFRVFLT